MEITNNKMFFLCEDLESFYNIAKEAINGKMYRYEKNAIEYNQKTGKPEKYEEIGICGWEGRLFIGENIHDSMYIEHDSPLVPIIEMSIVQPLLYKDLCITFQYRPGTGIEKSGKTHFLVQNYKRIES